MARNYNNWLQQWITFFTNTEVPAAYAAWTGIWCIACALQDNVWLPRGHDKLYPNLYIFLVGPSGGGKGYSGSLATKVVSELPTVNLHEGQLSISFALTYLAGIENANTANGRPDACPALALYSDELANSVSSGERAAEFLRGMTQLYNSALQSGTHMHGLRKGKRPVISWLASATIRWLKLSIPADMVDSGFVARTITTVETLSTNIVPTLDEIDPQALQMLIDDLKHISTLKGQFTLSPEAQQFHYEWYIKTGEKRRRIRDQVMLNMYGRDDEHVLKVAMILSAAVSDSLIINYDMVLKATQLTQRARQSNIEIYRSIATAEDNFSLAFYVIEKLSEANGASAHTVLYRRCSGVIKGMKSFNEVINLLLSEGMIEVFVLPNDKRTTYYKLAEKESN